MGYFLKVLLLGRLVSLETVYKALCPCLLKSNADSRVNDWGLSWWQSGRESTCQCRRQSFDPWSRKIPHITEQVSPWITTTEPKL